MRKPVPTFEEARESRLREGRRRDVVGRAFGVLGIAAVGVYGLVLASAICGRVVPLGKTDLAAGNASHAILRSWDEATVVFSERRQSGPAVEARATAIGFGVPSGAEFRVDDVSAGLVFGPPASSIDLHGIQTELSAGQTIEIRLPDGYRPAIDRVRAGRWTVRYRRAKAP